MKCFNHSDRDAVGACTSCGRFICNGCSVTINSKMVCKECVNEQSRPNTNKSGGNVLKTLLKIVGWFIAGYAIFTFVMLFISFMIYG